jgi:hypothetical protein
MKKQIVILGFFSILLSIAAIIHGIYFDLDMTEITRLTTGGLILTFLVIFPSVIFLEWVFDIDNKKRIKELENRIKELEDKV